MVVPADMQFTRPQLAANHANNRLPDSNKQKQVHTRL